MSSPTPTASPSPPAVNPPASSPPPVVSSSPPVASSPPPIVATSSPPTSISPLPESSPPPVPPLTPPPVVSPPAPPISDPPPPILPPPAPPISTPPPETPVSPPPPSSSPPPPTPVLPPPSSSSPPPENPVLPPPPTSSPPPETPVQTPPPASSPPLATPPEPQPPSAPPSISTPSTPVAPSGELPPPLRETPSTPSISSDSPPPPSLSSSSSSSISPPVVVGIAVAGVALVALLSFLFCCYKRKKRSISSPSPSALPPMPPPRKEEAYAGQPQNLQHNFQPPDDHVIKMPPPAAPPTINTSSSGSILFPLETKNPPPKPLMPPGHMKSSFSYEELVMATDGFSDANLLGQGGFGYVHRGVLPSGQEVAVKQLKSGSGQGEREFQAEVEIISRVHHKHLVTLVGYSMAGIKRLLVYEFVPNNTLEFHLHGKGRPTMDWPNRLRIALGSAKGLAYLHEDCHPKIIHRDIKAANILLDYNFEAKVADFGLAKIASDGNTHVSTRVIGTFGYLSPEYAATGKLTDKSDVFSFGVMLLELITGRRPVDPTNNVMDESLVDWARPLLTKALEDGNFDGLVDPKLQNNYNATELSHMAVCAAAAVRHSAKHRPRMSQIVRALEGDASLEEFNTGIRPGQSSIYASHSSSDYDDGQYKEDMKRFKILALTSEEFEDPAPTKNASRSGGRRESISSDCSAATSEYGQNPSGSSSEGSPSRETKSPRTKNSVD